MKFAVSNIAWKQHDDPRILKILKNHGVSGIEVAPTKIWPNWEGVSHRKAAEYKKTMAEQGFEIPAMQAILFGKPDLQLFHPPSHPSFLEHIKLVAELAQGLGCKVLVFGAPKNRRRGDISHDDAVTIAVDFFREASDICQEYECCIGLEHNPREYGCDFITDAWEAMDFIQKVNHPAFKLHLDSGGIHMSGRPLADTISGVGEFVHFHISEPMLRPIFGGVVNHKTSIVSLKTANYKDWASIEMVESSDELLEKSVGYISNLISENHL